MGNIETAWLKELRHAFRMVVTPLGSGGQVGPTAMQKGLAVLESHAHDDVPHVLQVLALSGVLLQQAPLSEQGSPPSAAGMSQASVVH
jgi:hypothetical protein